MDTNGHTLLCEDYVSFETAKLLKEKGFPQDYDNYHSLVYNEEDYEDEYEVQRMVLQTRLVKAGTLSSYPLGVPEPKCYCPTQSIVMKWLREVHHIIIVIQPLSFNGAKDFLCDNWVYSVWLGVHLKIGESLKNQNTSSTYEEACEAAIRYCLENLI